MNETISRITSAVEQSIVGKRDVVERVIAALLCGGHVLIEDVPGVGKTKLVASLAGAVSGKFNRIQLTPDVMPSDITGFSMIHPQTREIEYRPGAAMCNFLLADEINRASPKVQSSLLEVMEEGQVSLDGHTYPLPKPFMVLATQNPVETYGTYHLPEAQMDRFLMKLSIGYPAAADELKILENDEHRTKVEPLPAVVTLAEVEALQAGTAAVFTAEPVKRYIIEIAARTRGNDLLTLGLSPRACIALNKAAKAHAFFAGRDFATPDDVKEMAGCVLSHRLILSPKGRAQYRNNEEAIAAIAGQVPVPVQA